MLKAEERIGDENNNGRCNSCQAKHEGLKESTLPERMT